jgi:DNA-binding MarR family transcriptional regulator
MMLTAENAAKDPVIPVVRELVRAYQAFESYSNANVKRFGLTPSQFDVIATLGNTDGMTFKELGERTLTTKGTLTGIIDRLEAKGLVARVERVEDRRSTLAVLTPKGAAMFKRVFPRQIDYLKERFAPIGASELKEMARVLARVRGLF